MFQSRPLAVAVGFLLAACFLGAAGQPAGAVERSRSSRTGAAKLKGQNQQPAAEPEAGSPESAELGDDHQKNIEALQRERLETLRQRVDLLNRAFAVNKASEEQVDHATLEQLQAELETQDRPHLRVQGLKKIVELRQKFEDLAKLRGTTKAAKSGGDPSAIISAHGRYVSARLARINAQMALERELLAQQKEGESPKAESKAK